MVALGERRELNQKTAKLEQADKQNTDTIKQLRAANEAMRMELRLLRPKNAELKALDSHYLPETEGLHRKYR